MGTMRMPKDLATHGPSELMGGHSVGTRRAPSLAFAAGCGVGAKTSPVHAEALMT
jgi:hypothetical protein